MEKAPSVSPSKKEAPDAKNFPRGPYAGLEWHNDAVLLNQIGTGALRAGRLFNASRKLVRVHQNVLTFVKGDLKEAVAACGDVSDLFSMPEEATD